MEEIEVKFLEIDPKRVENELLKLGAKKIFDEVFEEWIFSKADWREVRGRVRVRKNGKKILLAYKETIQSTSAGNLEVEFEVSSLDEAIKFVEKMGVPLERHQQKRRIHFEIDGLCVDVDFWPKLPPYLEIEGNNIRDIENLIKKLEIREKRVELDAVQIYEQIYGISLKEIK